MSLHACTVNGESMMFSNKNQTNSVSRPSAWYSGEKEVLSHRSFILILRIFSEFSKAT